MKYTEQIVFVVSFGVVFYYAYGNTYDSAVNYEKGLFGVLYIVIMEGILKDCIPFQKYSAL